MSADDEHGAVPEFSWGDAEIPDDVTVQYGDGSGNEDYRTCSTCGGDCEPEAAGAEGLGARVAFVCPEHGLHAIVDPFDGRR